MIMICMIIIAMLFVDLQLNVIILYIIKCITFYIYKKLIIKRF